MRNSKLENIVTKIVEIQVKDNKKFTGSMVRAFDIYGGLPLDTDAVKSFEENKNKHYGHIAPILIRKILEKKEELPQMYMEALSKLGGISMSVQNTGITDRLLKTFGVFMVAGHVFEEILKENGEETRKPLDICETIMKDVMVEISDETYAVRAIKHIYSWIDTKHKFFLHEGHQSERAPSDIYGNFFSVSRIDIYVKPLRKELEDAGLNYDRVVKDFESLRWIEKKNDQIKTVDMNGRGIKINTFKIKESTGMETPMFNPAIVESCAHIR